MKYEGVRKNIYLIEWETYSKFDPISVVAVCQENMSAGSSSFIETEGGSNSMVRPSLIRSSDESLPVIKTSLSHPPLRILNSSLDKSCMLLPTGIKNVPIRRRFLLAKFGMRSSK